MMEVCLEFLYCSHYTLALLLFYKLFDVYFNPPAQKKYEIGVIVYPLTNNNLSLKKLILFSLHPTIIALL